MGCGERNPGPSDVEDRKAIVEESFLICYHNDEVDECDDMDTGYAQSSKACTHQSRPRLLCRSRARDW